MQVRRNGCRRVCVRVRRHSDWDVSCAHREAGALGCHPLTSRLAVPHVHSLHITLDCLSTHAVSQHVNAALAMMAAELCIHVTFPLVLSLPVCVVTTTNHPHAGDGHKQGRACGILRVCCVVGQAVKQGASDSSQGLSVLGRCECVAVWILGQTTLVLECR